MQGRISRRQLLVNGARAGTAVAMGGAIVTLLDACSSSPSGSAGTGTSSSTVAVEIDEGQNASPFQWFNPDMQAKFGATTNIIGLPFVGQYEKIVSEMVTRSNVYDVLVFPPQMIGDFVSNGFLASLSDLGNESDFNLADILPAYRDPNLRRNGKLYAAAYDGDILQIAYRKDLFGAAGITQAPQSWDEFLNVAKELHKPPAQYGNAFLAQRGFCYAWFMNIFAALGGKWFTPDMKPAIDGDQGVQALQMLVQLKDYAPPNILQIGYQELNEAYLNGSTAMVVQWDDLALKAEDASQSKVVGKNVYAPCPVRNYMPYSRVLAVSAFSKNQQNAYKVAQYMSSADVSVKDVYDPKCGEDPFRQSHLDPSKVKDHTGNPSMPAAQAQNYVDAIKTCLTTGYPELSIPGAPRYLDILDLFVNEALAGSLTPAQALSQAASEWNSITTSLGQDNQVKAYADWVDSFHKAGVSY